MAGKLILCATPIGNLGDITPRVLDALREADRIAAEDTRNSRKLLTHFDIHTPMISYHENNRFDRGRELVDKMLSGETIALITDAGTPAISDPGEELVRMAYEAGIEVTSLPGAAACITALTLSGLPTRRFTMEGFLPREKKECAEILAELQQETRTMIFYESPHRLYKTLQLLAETFGPERRIAICRELTKLHEDVNRTTLGEIYELLRGGQVPRKAAVENVGTWRVHEPSTATFELRARASASGVLSSEEGIEEKNAECGATVHEQSPAAIREPRGEYVLVVEGRSREDIRREQQESWDSMSIEEHMQQYLSQGLEEKEAMKRVAKDRGVGKRDIYTLWKMR